MVPISHRPEDAPGEGNRLHRVAIAPRLPMAHVVAVDEVESAALAFHYSQVRISSGLVRQQHRPAGTKIAVAGVQCVHVEGSEIVFDLQVFPSNLSSVSP